MQLFSQSWEPSGECSLAKYKGFSKRKPQKIVEEKRKEKKRKATDL